MWGTHNDGPLPQPYAYGERPPPEDWGDGFGPCTVPPLTYRGVQRPDGPHDAESWRRGIDAALDRTEES